MVPSRGLKRETAIGLTQRHRSTALQFRGCRGNFFALAMSDDESQALEQFAAVPEAYETVVNLARPV